MKPFWAIVKLTLRNAVRSYLFQLLLFLLLLCVVLIPSTISGDGTAGGFIRISLLYSLSAVSTILALSSIWLGCFVMAQDIDNYQLHMVVTKPVSRVKIWLAKWVGINILHLFLLLVSALAIYFIIMAKYNQQNFPEKEREKIRNEVLVGRRVFWPYRPDYDEQSRRLVTQRIKEREQRGIAVDRSPEAQDNLLRDARREVISQDTQAHYGQPRSWVFPHIPDTGKPMFLRYRPYIGKVATEGQRMTRVWWEIGMPQLQNPSAGGNSVFDQNAKAGYEVYFVPMAEYPEQVMSGEFHEKTIPAGVKVITPDHQVVFRYTNADDAQGSQFFQLTDGPKLLIEVAGFFENYMRAILVIAMELLILSGLGCAFGGFLTMPTAVFVVISYLLFGSFAVYMTGLSYVSGAADQIGQFIAKLLLVVVIPLQAFEVTGIVASGEIIELALIWKLFWFYFLCRALPLFALGIFFYWRRELGLVIRK